MTYFFLSNPCTFYFSYLVLLSNWFPQITFNIYWYYPKPLEPDVFGISDFLEFRKGTSCNQEEEASLMCWEWQKQEMKNIWLFNEITDHQHQSWNIPASGLFVR